MIKKNTQTKGQIHVYTGNGKGKTTAAFGLALRAAGCGMNIFIGQFVKGKIYSEIKAMWQFLPQIKVKQYGLKCFIKEQPSEKDILAAKKGLNEMQQVVLKGKYDLVIFDEVNIALHYKLFEVTELISLLKNKQEHTEIILTGRYAPAEIIEAADLVTEMKEIKHYYQKGVEARKGIEY